MVAVAGVFATTVLSTATVASTQTASASVAVVANDSAGAAKLTFLAPVRFDSGAGEHEVTAGTQFTTTGALLASALPAHHGASVGDTLRCDLRISVSHGEPVVDLIRCSPARTSPRG